MFPIRDNISTRSAPVVTKALIAVNVLVFLYELSLGPRAEAFVFEYGVSPAKLRLFSEYPGLTLQNTFLPFLYAQFLHAGWVHLIGNVWYLWIFGDNVEDRLGHLRFLFFYLACGLAAMLVQCLYGANTAAPAIGASGAIAGVLGAYLVLFPGARILTLIPIIFVVQFVEIPALFVLGFWFLIQFLNGIASVSGSGAYAPGVAWWAHIGGFISGIVLLQALIRGPGASRTGNRSPNI